MNMKLLNNSGMTLVEVLVAIGISLISLTVLLQLTLSNRTHKSEVDRSIILKEILTNNAIELKGRAVTDIPLPGNCIVRTYSYQTEFQSEVTQAGNPPLCGLAEPSKDTIQVVWEVEPATSIDADFSSPSLKLPKYSNTLKKVTLHVRGYSSGAGARLIHNQVTLFKR
ncbi:PilW family protein [Bdellovibrio bacteriovorus]|uniref:PilW family protein n=1 Tax=Bdellovibrio bacteriovorus TaxID=959 RepID=UPI0035A57554